MARKFVKKPVLASNNSQSSYPSSEYVYWGVYSLFLYPDGDTEEGEHIDDFETFDDARDFIINNIHGYMDEETNAMHIVALPNVDEDEHEMEEYFEYSLELEPFQAVETFQVNEFGEVISVEV